VAGASVDAALGDFAVFGNFECCLASLVQVTYAASCIAWTYNADRSEIAASLLFSKLG
jgi:hypothetical protein